MVAFFNTLENADDGNCQEYAEQPPKPQNPTHIIILNIQNNKKIQKYYKGSVNQLL